jgi:hypothetical protein
VLKAATAARARADRFLEELYGFIFFGWLNFGELIFTKRLPESTHCQGKPRKVHNCQTHLYTDRIADGKMQPTA